MEEKEVILKLYHNVEMGVVGILSIEDKIDSKKFYEVIQAQKREYQRVSKEMSKLCDKYDILKKDLSSMAYMMSDMMANMKLSLDNSVSHIAKMMMEGTNKGLIELETIQNHYQGKDQELKNLISDIIQMEQKNNEELKLYL
ncbi:MAG: hypothetical protein IJ743_02435 [Bacilli bacterium]|nr:hypothetical protein [Bacilli bacterium]MBR1748637.1 hypothetical protein [Bacilli bacterium]MBR1817214.1 hypothetical protein [Bacilli bacterium]